MSMRVAARRPCCCSRHPRWPSPSLGLGAERAGTAAPTDRATTSARPAPTGEPAAEPRRRKKRSTSRSRAAARSSSPARATATSPSLRRRSSRSWRGAKSRGPAKATSPARLAASPGLSVVGNGFVYVRGLGDRYSLALLNGSPLPSPEPLRRVVPLDLFPSGVIASSLVQKSYSVNYPGEFGGGVINLTTKAVPREPFLTIGAGISGDTETTGQLGYTYYGSKTDWYRLRQRQPRYPARARVHSSPAAQRLSSGNVDTQAIAGAARHQPQWPLSSAGTTCRANFSANLTGGTVVRSRRRRARRHRGGGLQQQVPRRATRSSRRSLSADLSTLETDFRQVNTDQRIVVNGLLGLGYRIRTTTRSAGPTSSSATRSSRRG